MVVFASKLSVATQWEQIPLKILFWFLWPDPYWNFGRGSRPDALIPGLFLHLQINEDHDVETVLLDWVCKIWSNSSWLAGWSRIFLQGKVVFHFRGSKTATYWHSQGGIYLWGNLPWRMILIFIKWCHTGYQSPFKVSDSSLYLSFLWSNFL